MYAVMAAEYSSLAVTKICLPQMGEHCEMVIGTLSFSNRPELVISSYYIPVHLEWTDESTVPVQQRTLTTGELVITNCAIYMINVCMYVRLKP